MLLPLSLFTATAWAAPVKVPMQITGYVINADLDPAVNRLTATADVTFTALEELTNPTFELNNGLQVTKATDQQGKPLEFERLTNNNTVRFTLATPVPKGATTTYHFEYSGTLERRRHQPRRGHQNGRGRRSYQHPALPRPLVPYDGPIHQPLHRRDAHPRPRR